MKKIILMTFLLLSSAVAQEVNTKAMIGIDAVDAGVEFMFQSHNPRGFGVVGFDLDDSLPVFNFGYNHRFDDFDILVFTGFGFKKTQVTRTVTVTTTAAAVSSQGCTNGKGKGVQKQCNNGGSGNDGGAGNGGGNSPKTAIVQVEDESIFQEFGVRVVPRIHSNLNPLVEFTSATDDAGFSHEEKVKIGLIYKF